MRIKFGGGLAGWLAGLLGRSAVFSFNYKGNSRKFRASVVISIISSLTTIGNKNRGGRGRRVHQDSGRRVRLVELFRAVREGASLDVVQIRAFHSLYNVYEGA